jgi:hypothetical protein
MPTRPKLREKLTYSNLMVTLLAFAVLGGGVAWAALGKNTVGSAQIKKNAVKAAEIASGAVGAPEIKASAVKSTDIADGSLLGKDFAPGQLPVGASGPPGPPGALGITTLTRRLGPEVTIQPDDQAEARAPCQPGEWALSGGGIAWNGSSSDFDLNETFPLIENEDDLISSGVATGWAVRYTNKDVGDNNIGDIDVRAYAVCAVPE